MGVIYWRNDAFGKHAELFYRTSAVFLVSLLVAMHYYTRSYRHKKLTTRRNQIRNVS
jgi:hypothetical protein